MTPPADWARPWRCPQDDTCPAKRSHDTYSAYRVGCTSGAAVADAARYRKTRLHSVKPRRRVPSLGARRRLQALAALGWHFKELGARSGLNDQQLGRIARGHASAEHLYASTDRAIRDLFTEMAMTVGPSSRARNDARRRGWAPPLAWDDLDDPLERPKTGKKRPGYERINHTETVAMLTRAGHSIEEIARDLGISTRTVERTRRRINADARQTAAARDEQAGAA